MAIGQFLAAKELKSSIQTFGGKMLRRNLVRCHQQKLIADLIVNVGNRFSGI